MTKHLLALAATLALASPVFAQEPAQPVPSPNEIVNAAQPSDWVAIAPEDLLVMTLAPDAQGNARKVVIQLMPAPFSQGWVENIRTLARAGWYDDISVNRVQDNYVVQWGDPNYDNPEAEGEAKPLPEGLRVMDESEYTASIATTRLSLDRSYALTNILRYNALRELIGGDFESANPEAFARASTGLPVKGGDSYAQNTLVLSGWPMAMRNDPDTFLQLWPVHCYGMVGVGRSMSPDTGSGAELYTVIGHAPRHLDRNIALVGRIVEGMEHLSSLPRGSGPLGFYTAEEAAKRTPILSVRVAADLPAGEQPQFQYLATDSESFERYAEARANRRDPFFIVPAGGADICNIAVPVRRMSE